MTQNSEQIIGRLLNALSKEEIIDFLVKYAKNDPKFVDAVNVYFLKPKFESELGRIESKIDVALAATSDYRSYGGWGYIDVDVSDIIMEVGLRAEQGHIRLAFAELELLYRKLLENFEYQAECEISDEAENCLCIMSDIADKAILAEDKDYIFKQCIELSELEDGKDYGADYEGALLKIAAKFVTPENLSELEAALACFDSDWREEEFCLIRLEIVLKIQDEAAADAFIAQNIRFPKIREIAFDKAVSQKNYSEGERLCIVALAGDKQYYGISPWLYKLYSVYEMTENTAKMTETAQEILLSGDLEYYDKLKSLLVEQAVWNSSYLELLKKCESRLAYSQYMEILAAEGEYSLLHEQVEKHPEQVYLYGKLLAGVYPAEICEIFFKQIGKEADAAYGREEYRKVCSHILCFAETGYGPESNNMIDDYKIKFKRKPAFVDELSRIFNNTNPQ